MEMIYLAMPASDWDQIESDLENIYGCDLSEAEVGENIRVQWRGTPEE